MTAETDDGTEIATAAKGGSGIGMEAYLGLVWLGTSAYVAHATLTAPGADLDGAVGTAAEALPGLLPAMLITSAAIAGAAAGRFRKAAVRLAAGLGIGAVFGVIGAVAMRYGYGDTPSITDLAVVLALAGLIGGSAAALPEPARDAFQWGTHVVLFAGVMAGVASITGVFGGGLLAPEEAQAAAVEKLGYIGAVVGGLLAGLQSPAMLKRESLAFWWYPLVGALPGTLLLVASRLMDAGGDALAGQFQVGDGNALRHAVIALVLGAIVAAIVGIRHRRNDD
jgi:hypothetical protein